jgi:ABC-type branched-subunit amino acid transport system substrate-binding protein
LAVSLLAVAACGTRVSDSRIRAAAFLGSSQTVAAGQTSTSPLSSSSGSSSSGSSPSVGGSGTQQASTTLPGAAVPTAAGGSPSAGGPSAVSPSASPSAASASGGASSGTAGHAATGSEIAIGVLGTFSGPVGVYVKDLATAVQVWGDWINNNGGLNGHRVKVIVADDGGSPATFNSRAQQMVEQDHVLAFAITTLGLAPGGNNAYLDSVHVPTFGTEGGLNTAYSDPYVLTAVPAGTLYAQAMMFGYAKAAKPRGVSKIAILSCSDFGLCDNFDQQWASASLQQETGLQVVYRARPSLTTPDFTSICIDARNAGAQGILNGMDTASLERLADDCARQGYHPVIGLADLLARPELAQDSNADGSVVGTKMVPWFDQRVPGIVQMTHAFAQYAPGLAINGTLAGGWLAASFLQAASASLPTNPTSKDFLNGLSGLNGTTLGGLTYPLHYTPGQPSSMTLCYSSAVIQNKTFVSSPGPSLSCH